MAENQVPTSKTIKVRVVSHPDAQYIGQEGQLAGYYGEGLWAVNFNNKDFNKHQPGFYRCELQQVG